MRINPWWIAGFVMLMALLPLTYKLVVGLMGFMFLVNRVLTRIMGLVDTGSRVKAMVDDLNERNENEIVIEDSE
ncbi:MAG: hypothetical protein VX507_06820 [Gemmatimonadota bacterium]|jgi:hypothetical protein|nr:hypothetical protein [Gemmatimonadota bacterium]|tara:strand:- start:261 stop:482 length:222 start_codon:yes stop_codon:yes gene_type:complete